MEEALVDTSIILEPFVPWKNNEPNYKRRSLSLLRGELYLFYQGFKPIISISIMGELDLVINEKISLAKEIESKKDIMEKVTKDFFSKCKRVGLTKQTIELCNQIFQLDLRIDHLDALHIATAISENCKNFIFIDYELKGNMVLKKFAKDKGLTLVDFAIKNNMDIKRPKGLFRELE